MDFAFYGEVSVCLWLPGADRGLLGVGWHRSDRAARGRLDWDGRMLIVRSAATDSLAEGDEVFVIADPRSCALLEE